MDPASRPRPACASLTNKDNKAGHCLKVPFAAYICLWALGPGNPFKLIARQNKPFTKCLSDTTANMRI